MFFETVRNHKVKEIALDFNCKPHKKEKTQNKKTRHAEFESRFYWICVTRLEEDDESFFVRWKKTTEKWNKNLEDFFGLKN